MLLYVTKCLKCYEMIEIVTYCPNCYKCYKLLPIVTNAFSRSSLKRKEATDVRKTFGVPLSVLCAREGTYSVVIILL